MTAYVAGFAFDQLQKVWLIRKLRPEWQAGKLNGIGGAVVRGERHAAAMSREFNEEAGLQISEDRWIRFHSERWGNGNSIDFYVTRLEPGEVPTSRQDEQVQSLSWIVLTYSEWAEAVGDLPYLVPMAYTYLLDPK